LLKGRANYVCHYHLERNLAEAGSSSREIASDLQRIVSFARVTRSGDKSEFADVPEESPAWNLATSTRENCLGQACPRFRDCFVMAARREALAALDSALRSVCAALDALSERSEGLARCAERARTAHALLERWRDDSRADLVRWMEVFSHSLRLNATPLSIAGIFRRQLDGR